jgi:hypothetical protein
LTATATFAGSVQGVVVQMSTYTFSPFSLGRTSPKSDRTGNLM